MKRVEIGPAILYRADCRDVLPMLGKVDAVVTDPPYGIGFKYESHVDDPDSYPQFLWPIVETAERLVAPGGPIFVWQAQEWMPRFSELFPRKWRVMIAAKNFVQLRATPMQHAYEPVVVWWKDGAKPWKSPPGSQYVNRDWHVANSARAVSDVNSLWRKHPCPRQVDSCEFIVSNWVAPAKSILDPFMGSGTTGVAAIQLGRRFIGIEKDPAYFKIAVKRIREAVRETENPPR